MTMPDPQQIELERLLFRYSMALERGDFDTVTAILQIAAHNTALNRMIQELDAVYAQDSITEPTLSGENTMQTALPLDFPQKRKLMPPNRRSLLFPAAAVIALALVGFSLISFTPQPQDPYGQGAVRGNETATSTPFPATVVAPSHTPTPVPFGGTFDQPTIVPGGPLPTFTPTPAGPTQPPTVVPPADVPTLVGPTIIPSLVPSIIPRATLMSDDVVPIYCEGITRGEPETILFSEPFTPEEDNTVVGAYEPNLLMPINDVVLDAKTGETWYYIGDANIEDQTHAQGWTSAANIELMWNCGQNANKVRIYVEAANLLQSLNPDLKITPIVIPTLMPPFSPTAISPTATPLPAS